MAGMHQFGLSVSILRKSQKRRATPLSPAVYMLFFVWRHEKMKKVMAVLVLGILVSATQASVVTLGSDADTWLRDGSSDNYGASPELYLLGGTGRLAYYRFDLSALGSGAVIQDATLTLSKVAAPWGRSDSMVTSRVGIFGLDDLEGNTPQGWDEFGLTAMNVGEEFVGGSGGAMPIDLDKVINLDADRGANVSENVANGVTFTLTGEDLVNFLQARVENGGYVTFIAALTQSDQRGFWLGSKEYPDEAFRPVLEVTFVPVPEPASMIMALVGVGSLALGRRKRNSL
jgi:hypothetical protein